MTTDTFGNHVEQRHDVEHSAALLKRLYLVHREQMRTLAAKHIAIEDWTAKNALPRHWWLASLHADALRERGLVRRRQWSSAIMAVADGEADSGVDAAVPSPPSDVPFRTFVSGFGSR